jgi:hypothetical protein
MARAKPAVEWVYNRNTYCIEYGLLGLAGKWAVVRAKERDVTSDFEVITEWVDDRKTAIGFLKLLKGG